jgi:hypothetical protein
MQIAFRTHLCAICLFLQLTLAPHVALYAADTVAPPRSPVPAVCRADGVFDLSQARALREMSRQSHISSDRLVELRETLDSSMSQCESGMNAANATFVAGLYENMGDAFLSLQNYEQAVTSYVSAESLFIRFPHPDVLWLQTLRGHALSELSRGNKVDAELLASKQSTLARDWVRERSFVTQELRFALIFEADVCDKTGNSACSQDRRIEAKGL